jgi:hypothetical protein
MRADLDGVEAKIARGEEHIDAVARFLWEYIDKTWNGVIEEHRDKPRPGAYLLTDLTPPLRAGIIAGDAIHNLRSALDHLVWDLVAKNHGTPTATMDFPLLLTPPTDGGGKPRPFELEGQVPSVALAEIERLQPYNAGNPSQAAMTKLGMLRELDNVNKHRHIVLTTTRLGTGSFAFQPFEERAMTRWIVAGHMDDGAVLMPDDPGMQMKARLALEIVIAQSLPVGKEPPAFPKADEPLISTLRLLLAEVRQVVDTVRSVA